MISGQVDGKVSPVIITPLTHPSLSHSSCFPASTRWLVLLVIAASCHVSGKLFWRRANGFLLKGNERHFNLKNIFFSFCHLFRKTLDPRTLSKTSAYRHFHWMERRQLQRQENYWPMPLIRQVSQEQTRVRTKDIYLAIFQPDPEWCLSSHKDF